MIVSEVVADGVRRAGVPRVFVAESADRTLAAALRASLPTFAIRRAASAVIMAAVTARLGEAPGVAVLDGDGADVTAALDEAARARLPLVVIASREPGDAVRALKTTVVASAASAAHWIAHAAQAAMGEPSGVVWLVVPPAVASSASLPMLTRPRPAIVPFDARALDEVAERVAGAIRPLAVAGRGARAPATAGWLRAFAETLPAPVLVTPAARGVLPDPHPLCFGLLRGDAAILGRADLILLLGVDDDELAAADVRFAVPTLQLGRAPSVAVVLEELASRLRDRSRADWDVAELDRIRRAPAPLAVDASLSALVAGLREATPAGTVAVFDRALSAATPLWQAVNPGEVIVTDGAVPAAIAAALERHEDVVLAITTRRGDDDAADAAGAGVRLSRIAASPNIGFFLAPALAGARPSVIIVTTG